MPSLQHELAVGRGDGSYARLLAKLADATPDVASAAAAASIAGVSIAGTKASVIPSPPLPHRPAPCRRAAPRTARSRFTSALASKYSRPTRIVRPADPQLKPAVLHRDAFGQAPQLSAQGLNGQLHVEPSQPRLPELGNRTLVGFFLMAGRRPGPIGPRASAAISHLS